MPIHILEPCDFNSTRAGLAALLLDSVAHGASVGFLSSIDQAEADAFWREVETGVVDGSRLLLVFEHDGALQGTVQLALCQRSNGRNRAEVQKLLVHSAARRRGIARSLMAAVEEVALAQDRGLLYLDTLEGSEAEPFYRSIGYTHAGSLPDYASDPAGKYGATALYFKLLFRRSAR
jgi:acetyltransferase